MLEETTVETGAAATGRPGKRGHSVAEDIALWRAKYPDALVCTACGRILASRTPLQVLIRTRCCREVFPTSSTSSILSRPRSGASAVMAARVFLSPSSASGGGSETVAGVVRQRRRPMSSPPS